jgi:hypothetical protein
MKWRLYVPPETSEFIQTTTKNTGTDLIKALLDNSSVNTFLRATIEAMSQ